VNSSERRWEAFAIAAPGVAPLLARELTALGAVVEDIEAGGVSFHADYTRLWHLNCWSRLASRIVVRVARFVAKDFATLEKEARRVAWDAYVPAHGAVALAVTCRKSRLYHSDAVAERVARAVHHRVRGATFGAPHEDSEEDATLHDTQRVLVRFERDVCTVSVDCSGALLHRRGWRLAIAKAPLRETLAAAMLAAVEWTPEMALVDPFSGSGTIGIEAAQRALQIAAGASRTFALEAWPCAERARDDVAAWRAEARSARRVLDAPLTIVLSDRDRGAVAAAHANAERAGVADVLTITERAVSDVDLRAIAAGGLVLTNPPYGLRIGDGGDLRNLYARFGDVVRAGGAGWRIAALAPSRALLAPMRFGWRVPLTTSHGGLPVSLLVSAEASQYPTRTQTRK
jgi:putative N6-adenine-specific DNA methylase